MKGFRLRGHLIIQHPRNQASDGVREHHCGTLTAGQHIIPDGDIICHNLLEYALVNALIVTAEQDKILLFRQLFRQLLGKQPSLGREINRPDARA